MNLNERLIAAAKSLEEIYTKTSADRRAPDCYSHLDADAKRLKDCKELIEARSHAKSELDNLDGPPRPAGPNRHRRFLAMCAYLAAKWALSDEICAWSGQILCTEAKANNPISPAKLTDFCGERKCVPSPLATSLGTQFGWPISLGYSLRNFFLHEGAPGFFKAETGFAVEAIVWDGVRARALKRANPQMCRDGFADTMAAPANLCEVLYACEVEMDEALGIVLNCACALIRHHAASILGEI